MVPNQAEILQPLWISKRSQDGLACVRWVCPNVLCKRCKMSFLLFPWTSRSFPSLYARSRYMRHLILYFILFLPIIIIRIFAGSCKNPHVRQLKSSWPEEEQLILKDLEVILHLCWNGFIWRSNCSNKILKLKDIKEERRLPSQPARTGLILWMSQNLRFTLKSTFYITMDVLINHRFSSQNPINKLTSRTLQLDHIACKNNHPVPILHGLTNT